MSAKTLQGKYAERLELKNEELQERIDKAIEYINHYLEGINNLDNVLINSILLKDLLIILGDKENGGERNE
jgi:hypothetical protein